MSGVYATFRVVNDVFRAAITNPAGIDQALALWQGQSQAKIPVGQLECGNGTYNCGWAWRMNPASITFAEVTIEVCDATPSYVQDNCSSFPNGQYCPWSAELIELRDCRTQASCPVVPRPPLTKRGAKGGELATPTLKRREASPLSANR